MMKLSELVKIHDAFLSISKYVRDIQRLRRLASNDRYSCTRSVEDVRTVLKFYLNYRLKNQASLSL